jgi:hypothetical protein
VSGSRLWSRCLDPRTPRPRRGSRTSQSSPSPWRRSVCGDGAGARHVRTVPQRPGRHVEDSGMACSMRTRLSWPCGLRRAL